MRMIRRGFLRGMLSLSAAPSVASIVACSSKESSDDGGHGAEGGDGAKAGRDYGELVIDPEGLFDLPAGFSYVVLERSGDEMSDGHPAGARPDGMACFAGKNGEYVLLRNHEVDVGPSPVQELAYDANMQGGVSRVVVDAKTLERLSSNYVLVGTTRNCAGGPSPWGWLSCEEAEEPRHGYVFVCDPEAASVQKPQRAASLGRFKHEAAAVDPDTDIIYLTEDQGDSALYRHVPTDGPFVGRLEALCVVDRPGLDLSADLAVGDEFTVEWVAIEDPEGDPVSTREQARASGAALVKRGEGIWYHDGSIFFVSTSGGPLELGQVFRLDPRDKGDRLTLIAQAESGDDLVNPDNITVAPWGDVFVAEDNDGPNHLRRIRPDGRVETFGRNALEGGSSELCGACFSPDGKVLFVNLQEPGITLAIRGPFQDD